MRAINTMQKLRKKQPPGGQWQQGVPEHPFSCNIKKTCMNVFGIGWHIKTTAYIIPRTQARLLSCYNDKK